jgi:hypothetical protein
MPCVVSGLIVPNRTELHSYKGGQGIGFQPVCKTRLRRCGSSAPSTNASYKATYSAYGTIPKQLVTAINHCPFFHYLVVV